MDTQTADLAHRRRWRIIYPLAILAVCSPYAISFVSQLSSDDFILIYYYGTRPLSRLWTVFSPRTIWTWHPLQHSYFVLGWHLSGIEPWAYRALSLAVHLGTTFLLLRFARELTGSFHFAGCTALLYAGYWRHWEAIAWAASIATLESVFFSMLACVAFLRFLRTRRAGWYALMLLAAAGWFCSKETIIQLPLLLAAIFFYERWRVRNPAPETPGTQPWRRVSLFGFARPEPPAPRVSSAKESNATSAPVPPSALRPPPLEPPRGNGSPGNGHWMASRAAWLELVRLLAAPTALVILYLIFYGLFVRNVYTFAQLGYERVPAAAWPGNILRWFDVGLNPLMGNDVVDSLLGPRGRSYFLRFFLKYRVVAVFVILSALGFAVLRRRPLSLFALILFVVTMIPYFAIPYGYMGLRYHYGTTLWGALLAMALGREYWRLARGTIGGWQSLMRVAVAACGGLWVVACLLELTHILERDIRRNRPSRELYDFFAGQTDKADRPVLFVVDTEPVSHSVDVPLGWGLLEAARVALRTDTVAAVELGYDLEPHVLTAFNRYGEKYLVKLDESGWQAERLPENVGLALTKSPDGIGKVTLETRR